MNTEKKAGKEPLLYINQPRLEDVKGNMQVTYRSSKNKLQPKQGETQIVIDNKTTVREQQNDNYLDELKNPDQETGVEDSGHRAVQSTTLETQRKTATASFRKLKPFRDLTIEEKLDYISASISGKVPFPCEFSNGEVSVKGVIQDDEGDEITVKSFNGEEVRMRKNTLQTIKMIGLQ
ncbi:CotO family spore coat protein [Bacillus sp. BHET2]|uniref:CotO family spore coat protein n=1 Tax=Bacillus sp. BHET2 TaxID=2583818 RepID=UPI00148647CE|nr:CotO family spore coat protein [Bacillus sp. BHET2]